MNLHRIEVKVDRNLACSRNFLDTISPCHCAWLIYDWISAIPIDEDLNTDPDTTTDPCEGDPEDADFLRFLLRLVWDDRTG